MPARILLVTLNAKYIHASLGLRYLLANMQRHGGADLRACTTLREFTIHRPAQEVVDAVLAELDAQVTPAATLPLAPPPAPPVQIVGFGVYIWNVLQTTEVVRLLKAQRPNVKVVLGGPEVSHELDGQAIVQLADHVITGWGDVSFPQLCRALVYGPQPLMKVIAGVQPPLEELDLPYLEYSAIDIAQRVLYVEASRGCPFKCEFCLSALDKTAWAFEQQAFLAEIDTLYQRGARSFKFVDRTFNLKIDASVRVLQFFLDRLAAQPQELVPNLQLHFEVVPDHLPERLQAMLVQFPAGVLQLEIGIQSFNPEVQQRISRRQDNATTSANIAWLVQHTQAHLHTDLIFGLPGETWHSFAQGFDALYALHPHEIQLGLLKRLRGTPLANRSKAGETAQFGMAYQSEPPYTVLQTDAVSAQEVQAFTRLARYWDLVANSGRFVRALVLVLEEGGARARARAEAGEGAELQPVQSPVSSTSAGSAFAAFRAFADWLWARTQATSTLTPEVLLDALFDYLTTERNLPADHVRTALLADYVASGARSNPKALQGLLPRRESLSKSHREPVGQAASSTLHHRQDRHQRQPTP